jgi:hypothetical protein
VCHYLNGLGSWKRLRSGRIVEVEVGWFLREDGDHEEEDEVTVNPAPDKTSRTSECHIDNHNLKETENIINSHNISIELIISP